MSETLTVFLVSRTLLEAAEELKKDFPNIKVIVKSARTLNCARGWF
jgi:hypothetical protein